MCSGKTHYSKIIGEMLGKEPFHLDHITTSMGLVEGYRQALESGLIEGYTPFRNAEHLRAITEAIGDREVRYILVSPTYKQWKENCKPIIACPTDENPPDYSEKEYEAENRRLAKLEPIFTIR